GDCEDYALRKRQLLVAASMPRSALRVAVVINELGEGHAVLLALTSGGDLVLDNRTPDVVRWDRVGYTFVKRESDDGTGWSALRPSSVRPAEAASVR
ncbi:transglutaminase-like cysteine peptidase, partial|uniref:transglutaminase-like cysteine peptidase n=1 Tax=Escherichia coli TaxID=562 RepID=UPI0014445838